MMLVTTAATLIRLVGAAQDARTRLPVDERLFRDIGASGDMLYTVPLIDTAYFFRGTQVEESILFALERLTGKTAKYHQLAGLLRMGG